MVVPAIKLHVYIGYFPLPRLFTRGYCIYPFYSHHIPTIYPPYTHHIPILPYHCCCLNRPLFPRVPRFGARPSLYSGSLTWSRCRPCGCWARDGIQEMFYECHDHSLPSTMVMIMIRIINIIIIHH